MTEVEEIVRQIDRLEPIRPIAIRIMTLAKDSDSSLSEIADLILNDPAIDEIVTTSTIPQILNRDMQGRLRHKMVVLRIARWVSNFIWHHILEQPSLPEPLYVEDMSSKNPRWKGNYGPLFGGS